ncbi:MAG: hypothetical protein IPK83_24415 [Planctomycetes bacterium]|nr:hypothetical protein [Planctomycetota bacterium]
MMSPDQSKTPRRPVYMVAAISLAVLTTSILLTTAACSPGLLALLYVISKEQESVNNSNSNAVDPRCPPPPIDLTGTTISYVNDVRPILQANGCLSGGCHGGTFPSNGYSLRDYNPSFGPGDDAEALGICAIVPGDAGASFMIEKLRDNPRQGARMPLLREALSETEIGIIETWINEGAQNN